MPWEHHAMGTNVDAPLQEFFDRFELPIRSVEFTCVNGYVLASVRFYIIPCDSVTELEKRRGVLLNKCSLFSMYVYPWEVENSEDLPEPLSGAERPVQLGRELGEVTSDFGRLRAIPGGASGCRPVLCSGNRCRVQPGIGAADLRTRSGEPEASVGPGAEYPLRLERAQQFDDGTLVRKQRLGQVAAQFVEQLPG